jgi:exosome complex RNA-binding protein Rrp42 (RNase PH superfamily)
MQAEAKRETKTILLTDPAREEDCALDGRITFSVNAHK